MKVIHRIVAFPIDAIKFRMEQIGMTKTDLAKIELMETLKYKLIKDKETYFKYYDILEELVMSEEKNSQDEVELLTLLIEKWDDENSTLTDSIN